MTVVTKIISPEVDPIKNFQRQIGHVTDVIG